MTSTPELRDGVEVFIYPTQENVTPVLFLFLSNRRRLRINCEPELACLLKELAKEQCLSVSLQNAGLKISEKVNAFLSFLDEEGIITTQDPLKTKILPEEYVQQYKRQIYFLLDMLKQPEKAVEAQRKIYDAHITLFGLGAMGSNLLLQLCMLGFRKFSLLDFATLESNDIARTTFITNFEDDSSKLQAAEKLIHDFAFKPEVSTTSHTLKTSSKLEQLIGGTTLIINTADKPYIGYTNIKLSRFALERNLPVLVAGGFDAHLASLGELLIPHVTPCADCYANFFEESLRNWKPISHPVKKRDGWFGGLGSLSAFSASTSALEILSHIIGQPHSEVLTGGRGEFLFHNYRLDTFTVSSDPNCKACGDITSA